MLCVSFMKSGSSVSVFLKSVSYFLSFPPLISAFRVWIIMGRIRRRIVHAARYVRSTPSCCVVHNKFEGVIIV